MSKRFNQIDGLRGVAIGMVVFYHLVIAFFPHVIPSWEGGWAKYETKGVPFFASLGLIGYVGVPLFFAISGACVALSYEKTKKDGWLGYARRRFFRIYPPYLLFLVLFCIMGGVMYRDFIYHAFLFHNLIPGAHIYAINPSFWSIAVEAQFYILFPLVLVGVLKFGWGRVVAGVIVLGCLIPCCFLFLNKSLEAMPVLLHFPLNTWCIWVFGAAIVSGGGRYLSALSGFGFWALVLLLLGLVVLAQFWSVIHAFVFILSGCVSVFFVWLSIEGRLGLLDCGLLRNFGVYSYSIYLFHQPAIEFLKPLWASFYFLGNGGRFLSFVCVFFCFCYIVGFVSYRILEIPAVRLGERICGVRASC